MTQQVRIATRDTTFVDVVRTSPIDEALERHRRHLVLALLVLFLVALVAGVLTRRGTPASTRGSAWSASPEVVHT
jgi:hypothetical protein